MKKITASLFMFSLILSSCSTSDDKNNPDTPESELPNVDTELVSLMEGGDNAAFKYENDLLVKGVGNSSSNHDEYYTGFQVEYDSDKKVERVLVTDYGPFTKPTDFSFDLKDGSYSGIEVYNYNFDGSRLSTITSETGKVLLELSYDEEGRVIEETETDYDSDYFKKTTYQFDSEGVLKSYVSYSSENTTAVSGSISTDKKINPFYSLWKTSGLIIPLNVSGMTAYNIPYHPHNVTEVYEGDELDFKAQMTYDGDYPVFYQELLSDIDGVTVEYVNE